MPNGLACELRDSGLERLIEIYGASETAGIAWRDDPNGPYHLLDRWQVAEHSQDGPLLLTGQNGQTALTPDEVVPVTPRSFTLRSRMDSAVQIGGLNVFPQRIADTLARHPLVAHARVRPASADEGGRLKALVVPRDTTTPVDDLRHALLDWITTHLAVAERPRSLTIASCLPKGTLGKECDWSENR
jgi:acyl-CoA synthetase (AMP-forming)/AMP-acid ligase II